MRHLRVALLSLLVIPSLVFAGTKDAPMPDKDSFVHIAEKTKKGFHADDAMFIIPLENGSHNQSFSAVKGILNGHHPARVNLKSHMSYYIISGDCRFTLADREIIPQKGDFITIKPNTTYEMDGNGCEALILSNPPFEKQYDKLVD